MDIPNDNAISLDSKKLQIQHTTEGYRSGITTGKSDQLQAGFDEGFGLGATIGLCAGRILGLLEGLVDSFEDAGLDKPARMDRLLSDAIKELGEEPIFAEEYWNTDGIWKYPVKDSGSKDETTSENIAKSHPAIAKWTEKIKNEVTF